jgi:hypothetical protein
LEDAATASAAPASLGNAPATSAASTPAPAEALLVMRHLKDVDRLTDIPSADLY